MPKFNKKTLENNNCKIFLLLLFSVCKNSKNNQTKQIQQNKNKNKNNIQIQKNRKNIIHLNRKRKQIQTQKLKQNTKTEITTEIVKTKN